MKIHVEKLNKTFDVEPTNKVMRSVYQLQLDLAKLSARKDKVVDTFSDAIKVIDTIEAFLTKTLHLSKSEAEKLDDDFDQNDISEMASYVSNRLMGMSDEDIKKDASESKESGPKK